MKKWLVLLAVQFILYAHAFSQTTIRGRVTDEKGQPISGASIMIDGTKKGIVTNSDGEFSIAASAGNKINISAIGFTAKVITVGENSFLEVVLQSNVKGLNDVVVVGYGTKRRKDLTSSIATVNGTDLNKTTAIGLDAALQGRAPGVQVYSNSGAPGSGVSIRVRGVNSFNGNNEPLYVVDGFPITNAQTGSTQGGQDRINGLAGINPSDIESIDILKDASAQAIYGARAANGVVLITTKRGKVGKPQIVLNTFLGDARITKKLSLLNNVQFRELADEANLENSSSSGTRKLNPSDPSINTDWQEEVFRRGFVTNTSLSLSGGADKTRYFASVSYMNQRGTIINSGFSRAAGKFNIDQTINNKLKVGFNILLSSNTNDRSRNNGDANPQSNFNGNNRFGTNIVTSALLSNPFYKPLNVDGTYGRDTFYVSNTTVGNPYAMAQERDLQARYFRMISSAFIDYNIFNGLKFRTNIGYDVRNEEENFYVAPTPPGNASFTQGGRIIGGAYNERYYNIENVLTYDKKLFNNRFNIGVIAGQSYQEGAFTNLESSTNNVQITGVQILSAGINPATTNNKEKYTFASLFGRATLVFDDKYSLQFAVRRDGSSRFGPEKKFGVFPAVSGFWRVSKEKFMSNIKWLDEWKIRGSFGVVGNAEIGNNDWQASLAPGSNYLTAVGVSAIRPVNETFSWESNEQLGIGTDISLLQGKVSVTLDYFRKRTKDLLLDIPIAFTSGFGTGRSNVGTFENKGFEAGLNISVIEKKNFNWNMNFNITFLSNKVISLSNGLANIKTGAWGDAIIAIPGEAIRYNVFTREKNVDTATGKIIRKDLNGDGLFNDADRINGGSPFPKHFGGFTNNFQYKNFDVSIFFQWNYGNKIYNFTRYYLETMPRGQNQAASVVRRWKKPGDVTDIPRQNWNGQAQIPGGAFDNYLEDGSFVRLKNIQLGYNLPVSLTKKMKIQNFRVYVMAGNLFTFTKYKGYDPEVSGATDGFGRSISVSEDNGTYPQPKTLVFGLNVTF
jgi:TonB-dependent starch-binding outer membrane protein SusC